MIKRRNLAGETISNYIEAIRFFCEFYKLKPKDRITPKSVEIASSVRACFIENAVREVARTGHEID